MIRQTIRIIVYFISFTLLQALVLNNMHLFGLMTPFVYIYVILKLPFDMNRSLVILLSFLLGLLIDIFTNTFGIHAAATTFMGFARTPVINLLTDVRELPKGGIPSYNLSGTFTFMRYVLILASVHHIFLFVTESFGFYQPWLLFSRLITSLLLSLVLIFIIEAFNIGKFKNG